jgi:hypothetical protein
MIGMPCGPPSKLWIFDVDVDASKGIDGPKALRELLMTSGEPLPPTRMSATPRSGEQYFFNWTGADIRNSASKFGPGLDVRGNGGYTILPPSRRTDGTPYRWFNSLPPVEAPLWLINAAIRSSHNGPPRVARRAMSGRPSAVCNGTPSVNVNVSPRIRAWAMSALRIACERIAVAAGGTRNDTLNAEAFDLFRLVAAGYLDEQQVRARLLAAACDCGIDADYGERSVIATINSAATAGFAQPRFYAGR